MGQFKVLVIGESAALRQHINFVLSQQRFIIIEASDIHTGLEKIQEESFYLVIVDNLVSPSSTMDFLQKVRKVSGCSAVPILLIKEESSPLLETGVSVIPLPPNGRIAADNLDFYYITKPFSMFALNSMVKKIFQDIYTASSPDSRSITLTGS